MPGSENRKQAKLQEQNYKDIKNTDADAWKERICDVNSLKFPPDSPEITTLADLVTMIDAYFELLKCAFPENFIGTKEAQNPKFKKTEKSYKEDLAEMRNDFNLKTLENKTDTTTAKWLTLVNDAFAQIKNLCTVSVWQISWDTSSSLPGDFTKKCKNLAKLLKISPFYFGHCPLIKYSQVRKAFAKLSETIEKFPSKILEILQSCETKFPDKF